MGRVAKTGRPALADRYVEAIIVIRVAVAQVMRADEGTIGIGYDGTQLFIWWDTPAEDEDED